MSICVVCSKKIENAKRSTKHYCSAKCRSAAHRSRQRVQRIAQSLTINMWEHIDLMEVKKRSETAYNTLQKMFASYGRQYAENALNAVMELMMDADLCSSEYWERSEREAKRHA